MKDTTRSAILASVLTTVLLVLLLISLFPLAVAYINTECEFRAKTQTARAEAKIIAARIKQDTRFQNITALGVYGIHPNLFGIHSDRTLDISFFGEVESSHVADLKAMVEETKPSFPVSWRITVVTNKTK